MTPTTDPREGAAKGPRREAQGNVFDRATAASIPISSETLELRQNVRRGRPLTVVAKTVSNAAGRLTAAKTVLENVRGARVWSVATAAPSAAARRCVAAIARVRRARPRLNVLEPIRDRVGRAAAATKSWVQRHDLRAPRFARLPVPSRRVAATAAIGLGVVALGAVALTTLRGSSGAGETTVVEQAASAAPANRPEPRVATKAARETARANPPATGSSHRPGGHRPKPEPRPQRSDGPRADKGDKGDKGATTAEEAAVPTTQEAPVAPAAPAPAPAPVPVAPAPAPSTEVATAPEFGVEG
jgi:hypothetical protein